MNLRDNKPLHLVQTTHAIRKGLIIPACVGRQQQAKNPTEFFGLIPSRILS